MRKSVLFIDVAIKDAFGYNFGYLLQFSSRNPDTPCFRPTPNRSNACYTGSQTTSAQIMAREDRGTCYILFFRINDVVTLLFRLPSQLRPGKRACSTTTWPALRCSFRDGVIGSQTCAFSSPVYFSASFVEILRNCLPNIPFRVFVQNI